MAVFRYKAVTAQGESLQGEMEAASEADVLRWLQQSNHIPLQVQASSGGMGLSWLAPGSGKLASRDVLRFTQQMSSLLNAGMPLDRSLQILHDLAENEQLMKLVKRVRDRVREGSSLADALEESGGGFSRLYLNMVRAGEAGGALEVTLTRLAEYLERSEELKSTVLSALIYPVLLVLMAVVSLAILLMVVVPRFMPMFEELGGNLPFLTQMVLWVAEGFKEGWWLLLLLMGLLWLYAKTQWADAASRQRWERRLLALGIFGDLLVRMDTARLSRTLSTLLQNGVAMMASLNIAKRVLVNSVLADELGAAAESVKRGGSLGKSLAGSHFPKLALQMIGVGEETGDLPAMLSRIADVYDREVRVAIDRALAILVPLMVILLAVLIGLIVFSIILAIVSINDMVI